MSKKKVFLGVGHGGSDPGAVGYLVEKDVNLTMATACRAFLAAYGVDTSRIGATQHTWFTSSLSPTQSFLAQWEAGLLWNTGYAAPNDPYPYPQANAHSVLSLPFFLTQDGEWTILLQNCASLLYAEESWPDLSARYGMPICVYYHCDFTAEDSATSEQKIQQV